MATKLVLLERVENLGQLGDIVTVKPGYARNFLLPQKKALRASKENIAYFEGRKAQIAADNDKARAAAEKVAKKLEGVKVPLIRQASGAGQLFGSVTSRDIATEISKATGEKIDRQMVQVNQNFKLIGLFPVDVLVHAEVKVSVTVNIARSNEEAQIQAKTGKALIVEEGQAALNAAAEEAALEDVLEKDALEATKEREAAESAEASSEAAESAEKSKARAAKKKAKPKKSDEETAEETEA